MVSRPSDTAGGGAAGGNPLPVKIVVSGGFAVGKTTFVGAISEIEPLTTEAAMTKNSLGVDDAGGGDRQDGHHGGHGLRAGHPRRPT